jgi:hypothetical protein
MPFETVKYADLARHFTAVFAEGPATRAHLAAHVTAAHPDVAAAVADLPYPVYDTLRDLSHDLADREAAACPLRSACM